jgi:uncharacterized Fe-S radical SAM superfamily protein PflX
MMASTTSDPATTAMIGACTETVLGKSSELRSRLFRVAEEKCIPITATIEVTLRCNLRCVHCYNFDRSLPVIDPNPEPELSSDEIISAIDQLRTAGCLYLSFTGGEALLHPSLLTFLQHARRRRMLVRMKTNGALLTSERMDQLVAAGTHSGDTMFIEDILNLFLAQRLLTVRGQRLRRDARDP